MDTDSYIETALDDIHTVTDQGAATGDCPGGGPQVSDFAADPASAALERLAAALMARSCNGRSAG
jgi:hypothetical protein